MKNQKLWIGIIAVVVVVIVAVVSLKGKKTTDSSSVEQSTASEQSTLAQAEATTQSAESASEATTAEATTVATENDTNDTTEVEQTGDDQKSSAKSDGSGDNGTSSNASANGNSDSTSASASSSGSSDTGVVADEEEAISFPYEIALSHITVKSLKKYSGKFLEDGSDDKVSGIAAITVKNTGDTGIEYALVTIDDMQFKVTDLPAGKSMLVQELNKTKYSDKKHYSCDATASDISEFTMSEDSVKVTEEDNDTISIENITDKDIKCVRVFYKYIEDGVYQGGITYVAKITDLPAGKSTSITPSHYKSDGSKVMMVRVYDTADDQ